jgi:aryl-alcohol dehydrogenase-like predicted oxidoreductase
MHSIQIPGSPVAVTRLGFGCARIFGGRERRSARKLIETALECGVRHFDTAPAYGSEEVLGEVLANVGDVTVATKIGLPRFKATSSPARTFFGPLYRRTLRPLLGRVPAAKAALLRLASNPVVPGAPLPRRRLGREEVLRELEDSLRRLRRSNVDLYLLHEPDGIEITDELQEIFASLQKEGLVGAFGLAFGAAATSHAFGAVVQCRYPGEAPFPSRSDRTPIYHGVVRFGVRSARAAGPGSRAGALIEGVLENEPGCAVIFSASTRHQILQIANRESIGSSVPGGR